MPSPGTLEDKRLTRFLKYVTLQAAIKAELRHRLVGEPYIKEEAGRPDRLAAYEPESDVVKAALEELFDQFREDDAETDQVAVEVKGLTFEQLWNDPYGLSKVVFVELWPGGSYILDSDARVRVLIAPAPLPVAYRVGIAVDAATPGNPVTITGGCQGG